MIVHTLISPPSDSLIRVKVLSITRCNERNERNECNECNECNFIPLPWKSAACCLHTHHTYLQMCESPIRSCAHQRRLLAGWCAYIMTNWYKVNNLWRNNTYGRMSHYFRPNNIYHHRLSWSEWRLALSTRYPPPSPDSKWRAKEQVTYISSSRFCTCLESCWQRRTAWRTRMRIESCDKSQWIKRYIVCLSVEHVKVMVVFDSCQVN